MNRILHRCFRLPVALALLGPAIAVAAMKDGESKQIEYLSWENGRSFAFLEDVHPQDAGGWLPNVGTTDPDFLVRNEHENGSQQRRRISYLTLDGSKWASECHAHTDWGKRQVTFSFDHYKADQLSHTDHSDGTIDFLAWDHTKWELSIKPVAIPGGGVSRNVTPIFILKRLVNPYDVVLQPGAKVHIHATFLLDGPEQDVQLRNQPIDKPDQDWNNGRVKGEKEYDKINSKGQQLSSQLWVIWKSPGGWTQEDARIIVDEVKHKRFEYSTDKFSTVTARVDIVSE